MQQLLATPALRMRWRSLFNLVVTRPRAAAAAAVALSAALRWAPLRSVPFHYQAARLCNTHLSCVLVADDEHRGQRLQRLEGRWRLSPLHYTVHGVTAVTLCVLNRHQAAGRAQQQHGR
jgi:hypothetical protein